MLHIGVDVVNFVAQFHKAQPESFSLMLGTWSQKTALNNAQYRSRAICTLPYKVYKVTASQTCLLPLVISYTDIPLKHVCDV